jgi:hypothetical protein
MAMEAPQKWADTTHREWLRGHIHHSAGLYLPVTSEKGVTARAIPALCPPDQWHVLHGFLGGKRAAEVLFYHRTRGPAGMFPVFVDEVTRPDFAHDKRATPPQHAGEGASGAGERGES